MGRQLNFLADSEFSRVTHSGADFVRVCKCVMATEDFLKIQTCGTSSTAYLAETTGIWDVEDTQDLVKALYLVHYDTRRKVTSEGSSSMTVPNKTVIKCTHSLSQKET